MKLFIALFVCLSLCGCQLLEEDKAMLNAWEGSPKLEKQEDSLFSANISAPKKVKANEMFTVIGNFDVKSNQKLHIASKEKVFTFLVKDSSGRQINSSFVTDVGKIREISGKKTITEKFNYKIKEPGDYEISAVAEFTLTKNGKASNYTFKTNTQRIEVIVDEQ
ncbi:hypothetical protein [Paenibacillus sp. QZ-Y1]|uniref:hypothetical protein n=1 Tax=Paenibacillus sp. QZ-Y1 TaxID=3414511 RepID=UPI003F79172B